MSSSASQPKPMEDQIWEKARSEESQRQRSVHAAPELLLQERHELVPDAGETDADYAARSERLAPLIDHARVWPP
jgi:hypothetical protein